MQTVVPMRESRGTDAAPATADHGTEAVAMPAGAARAKEHHAFVPLLLGLLAVVGWIGFQAWVLEQDRRQLQETRDGLQPTLERAARMRQSLDLLAADTQRLAEAGHAPARALVDELARRGITIDAAKAPPAAAAPADASARR